MVIVDIVGASRINQDAHFELMEQPLYIISRDYYQIAAKIIRLSTDYSLN